MREIEVDAVDAEPLEARVDLPPHALGCEPVILALGHRVEGLGRDAKPLRPTRADPLADVRLAAAAAVRVGGVEPGDAGLPGGVHQLERLLERLALAEEGGRRADAAEVAATEDDARPPRRRSSGRASRVPRRRFQPWVGSLHGDDPIGRRGRAFALLVAAATETSSSSTRPAARRCRTRWETRSPARCARRARTSARPTRRANASSRSSRRPARTPPASSAARPTT